MKSYRPPEIANAVRELASTEYGEGSGAEYLRTKDAANIQLRLRGSLNAHLVGSDELEVDIMDSMAFLLGDGYRVQEISSTSALPSTSLSSSASKTSSARRRRGFVFATNEQIKKLANHGWLTLMDSTHKTNKWDWRLFTLYVRDNVGSWCVGGHFFVDSEDSDIVTEALKIIRRFSPDWCPRYFLPDQSAVEANAVKKVFRGLEAGEMECTIMLCIVHVMRTWMSKIYGDDARKKMILAMHRRTKVGIYAKRLVSPLHRSKNISRSSTRIILRSGPCGPVNIRRFSSKSLPPTQWSHITLSSNRPPLSHMA